MIKLQYRDISYFKKSGIYLFKGIGNAKFLSGIEKEYTTNPTYMKVKFLTVPCVNINEFNDEIYCYYLATIIVNKHINKKTEKLLSVDDFKNTSDKWLYYSNKYFREVLNLY